MEAVKGGVRGREQGVGGVTALPLRNHATTGLLGVHCAETALRPVLRLCIVRPDHLEGLCGGEGQLGDRVQVPSGQARDHAGGLGRRW